MTKTTCFVLPVGLILAVGLATAGATGSNQPSRSDAHASSKATVHHESGKVLSLTANELVLEHRWRGKEEKTKFTLESDTKKDTNIKEGDRVILYYHFEKGQRIATELRGVTTKSTTETKKT